LEDYKKAKKGEKPVLRNEQQTNTDTDQGTGSDATPECSIRRSIDGRDFFESHNVPLVIKVEVDKVAIAQLPRDCKIGMQIWSMFTLISTKNYNIQKILCYFYIRILDYLVFL
jgi:hypothetical protein